MWRVLKLAARAAVWRTTPDPPLVGLPVLLGFAVVTALVRIALQLLAAGSWHAFNPYGLNAVVAWIALELAVAALFVRPAGRATRAFGHVRSLDPGGHRDRGHQAWRRRFWHLPPRRARCGPARSATDAIYAVAVAWWVGAMASVVGSLEPQLRLRLIGRAAALWAALFVANALVPHAPVFLPPDFDARNANWWEFLYALEHEKAGKARVAPAEIARIEKAQPALLQAEVARLAPPRKGVTDFYALGIAGWADQGVFVKELDGGLQAIASVLPIKDRTVRLINRRDTLETVPLADLQNFQAAVHAIGDVMDKDNDVLVLFMTSHGEKTGFALELPGAMAELTPQQVAATLDGDGIKNRVVIVSACYSGIFVPPLQERQHHRHDGFGCARTRHSAALPNATGPISAMPSFARACTPARISKTRSIMPAS